MLDRALRTLADDLDQHLGRVHGTTGVSVTLGPLVDADGEPVTGGRLILSVVRLSSEPTSGSRSRGAVAGRMPARPPLQLTVLFLLSVSPGFDYEEGLKLLSEAARRLNGRPRLDRSSTPALPEGIDELLVELNTLDLEAANNLWGMLGVGYRPSLAYRLRTVPLTDGATVDVGPPIESVEVEGVG